MSPINKTTVGIAAGVASTIFIGYCIYFDSKRRADPEYKKKLRERRRHNYKNENSTKIPNFNDQEAIERYFMQEIHMGESLIARGELENGVRHLVNAILVCGQPVRLLEMLQASLPAQVFAMLILKMQEVGNRVNTELNDKSKIVTVKSIGSNENSDDINRAQAGVLIDDLES
ncbi:mitochondrial import receptor subunit TOM20 homolog [Anastrepha ludens]|uniref:mitochondrial import receptor subunit TOM20 homolog n=1 Tax=Anastrepha ludens TaxID=28586 RepID=UPI0023AEEB28|nr:mitochondrial import receptor subunit TOM20 homolog [Anastrepha ludens]